MKIMKPRVFTLTLWYPLEFKTQYPMPWIAALQIPECVLAIAEEWLSYWLWGLFFQNKSARALGVCVYYYTENDKTAQPIQWLSQEKWAPSLPTLSEALTGAIFQSSLYGVARSTIQFSTVHIPKTFFNLHTCLVNRYALFSERTVIWQRKSTKGHIWSLWKMRDLTNLTSLW